MHVIQLLDKFCFGGGERVAITYNQTVKDLGAHGSIIAIKNQREAFEGVTLVNNYRQYFAFVFSIIRENKGQKTWLISHSSRSLFIALLVKLFFLSKVKVCFTQHLLFSSTKLKLYSLFQGLIDKCIQITPITGLIVGKYFEDDKLFYLNNYIHEGTYQDSVVSNPILAELIRFKASRKLVTFVGAVKKGKNAEHLVELAKILPCDEFCFLLIGDGDELPAIKQKVQNLNLENILFAGYQEHPFKFLAESDYLLFPSNVHEMMPMAVLEAKTNKCIVLGYDIEINKYILPKENIFVDQNFKGMAKAIIDGNLAYSTNEFNEIYGREKFKILLGLN